MTLVNELASARSWIDKQLAGGLRKMCKTRRAYMRLLSMLSDQI